jgi:hypothetical protein
MTDLVPEEVLSALKDHLRQGCAEGEAGWEAGQDEEDTLTGDLCGALRKAWQSLWTESTGIWRWRITYKKFRGRGSGAAESILGADGIVQLEVEDLTDGRTINKGLLFQAKKDGARDLKRLRKQVEKMECIAKGGSAVFEYGPNGYRGVDSSVVLRTNASVLKNEHGEMKRLGKYLSDRFLVCDVGLRGLFFDAVRRVLFVPNEINGVVQYRAKLGHRLKIEVQRVN